MKLLQYADEHWLIGDDAAAALLAYAVALGNAGKADSIEIRTLRSDGAEESVSILMGPATMLTATESASEAPEPDNTEAGAVLIERTRQLVTPPTALPLDEPPGAEYDL